METPLRPESMAVETRDPCARLGPVPELTPIPGLDPRGQEVRGTQVSAAARTQMASESLCGTFCPRLTGSGWEGRAWQAVAMV